MSSYKKDFISIGIILPVIAAVISTALFFIAWNTLDAGQYYNREDIRVSQYSKTEAAKAKGKENIVSNAVFGKVKANDKELELIFDADEVNALGRINVSSDSKMADEVGAMFLSCYKDKSDFVRSLKTDDAVKLELCYGDYNYRVKSIVLAESVLSAKKKAVGMERALVIYTDADKSPGLSDHYLAVVCEMTDRK